MRNGDGKGAGDQRVEYAARRAADGLAACADCRRQDLIRYSESPRPAAWQTTRGTRSAAATAQARDASFAVMSMTPRGAAAAPTESAKMSLRTLSIQQFNARHCRNEMNGADDNGLQIGRTHRNPPLR
jgi:hypothetical protein